MKIVATIETAAQVINWSALAQVAKKRQPRGGWEDIEFRVYKGSGAKFKIKSTMVKISKGDIFLLVEDDEEVYIIADGFKQEQSFSQKAFDHLYDNSIKKRMTLKDALKTAPVAKPSATKKPVPVEKRPAGPATPKVTKQAVLKAIGSRFMDLHEDKKKGYCYFAYDNPTKDAFDTHSVMVNSIDQLSLVEWVKEGKAFLEKIKKDHAAKPEPSKMKMVQTKKIIPYDVEKKLLAGKEITEQEYMAVSQLGVKENTRRHRQGTTAILMGPSHDQSGKQRMGMFGTDGTCLLSRENTGKLVDAVEGERRLPYKEWLSLWRQWRNKIDGIQSTRYKNRQDSAKRANELKMSVTWELAVEAEIEFSNGTFWKPVNKIDKKRHAIGIKGSGSQLRWIPMRLVKQVRPLNNISQRDKPGWMRKTEDMSDKELLNILNAK